MEPEFRFCRPYQGTAMLYAVVIENAGSNFSAYVPDLPGCVATGAILAEAEAAIREAMSFHLDFHGLCSCGKGRASLQRAGKRERQAFQ